MKKTMKMMLGFAAGALALGSAFGGALYETSVQAKVVNEASGVIDVILQNRYNDEVQRDIEFFGKNVLFLGTRCSAHSMEETTIPQSINAMAESANVRWYTCGSWSTEYDADGVLKMGESMPGTMGLTSGNHSCSDKFCKILYNELVTKGNVYVLLVLEFDSVSLLSNGTGGLSAEQVGKLRAALKPYYDEGRVAWVVSPGQNPPVSAAADSQTDYEYAILNANPSGYTCPNQKNYSNVSELSQFCAERVQDALSKMLDGHFGKDTFTFTVADGLTITETFAEFLDADGVWKLATASGVTESKYGKLVKASGGATGRTVKYEFDITGPEFAAYQANGAWGHTIRVTARCAGTDFLKPGTGEKPVLNGKGVITHEKPQDPTFKDQTTRDTLTDSDESPLISPEKVTVTFETLGHGENPAAQAVYKGTVAAEPANVS